MRGLEIGKRVTDSEEEGEGQRGTDRQTEKGREGGSGNCGSKKRGVGLGRPLQGGRKK